MSRLNDSVLIVREMVRQRWQPMGILNTGPGTNEDPFMHTLGKLAEDFISVVPWYDPTKAMSRFMVESWAKKFPGRNVTMGVCQTFEATLIALDALKRAGSPEAGKLIAALKATDIKDNVSVGPGVRFNEKGQNPNTTSSLLQNRGGRPLAIVPAGAADAKPIWPMRGWDDRGRQATERPNELDRRTRSRTPLRKNEGCHGTSSLQQNALAAAGLR